MSAFLLDCLATAARAALGICLATLVIVALLALWHFCQGLGAAWSAGRPNQKPQ
jgi:hypothetical protein